MALIRSELKDEIRVVFFDAPRLVDEATIEQCYREIISLLDKTEEANVLLHFGRVAFMSSAALGMLVRLHKKCKDYDISLKLCNIAPDIREVFKITRLDKVFNIYAEASGAVEAFKKAGRSFSRTPQQTRHKLS
jgi:anti-anti-sigma factor